MKEFDRIAINNSKNIIPDIKNMSEHDVRKLAHDLQVYKIELEMQNEELIHIQTELERSFSQFYFLFHEAPVGYLVLDNLGLIRQANKTFSDMTGYDSSEVINQPLNKYLPSPFSDIFLARYNALFKNPEGKTLEVQLYKKDNSVFNARLEGKIDTQGLLPKFKTDTHLLLLIVSDITKQKKIETELVSYKKNLEDLVDKRTAELYILNNRLKDELEKGKISESMLVNSLGKEKEFNDLQTRFITTVSHEFRTPLSVIFSSTELILRFWDIWDKNKVSEHLSRIQTSVHELTSLLDDVITINRTQAGKLAFTPEYTDIKVLCDSIIDDTRILFSGSHELVFNYSLPAQLFEVDRKLFRFIIRNLLSNAIKYSPKGGKILLKVYNEYDSIILEVCDRGIGIPEKDRKYIFDPFYRANNAADIKGTGLGLSIVKKSVEMHKGTIELVNSEEPDTCFKVVIPVQSSPQP